MVDYENPYQKKVVAPSNVFCFITQIKTTLLKKLGIIFIFRKKEKKMRPPRPTKRHKNTTKDQASVPSQCHDEPFGNPPPTSPRSVHHAPLELSGVSLKGHEGAAPQQGCFLEKKRHGFPKEIQHKSPLSKKKLTEICHANIGRSFLWEKKNKHQPLHPFRGHIPLVPATNKNTSRSCRSSARKLLKLRTEPFCSCSFIISARQSSRIDRPLSCQVDDLLCVFSKAAPNYINIYWHLVVLKPTVTRTHHFFTPKNGGSLQWGFKLPSLRRCSFQLCCKAAFKKFTLFPPVQRLGHVWHHGNLRVPRNAASPLLKGLTTSIHMVGVAVVPLDFHDDSITKNLFKDHPPFIKDIAWDSDGLQSWHNGDDLPVGSKQIPSYEILLDKKRSSQYQKQVISSYHIFHLQKQKLQRTFFQAFHLLIQSSNSIAITLESLIVSSGRKKLVNSSQKKIPTASVICSTRCSSTMICFSTFLETVVTSCLSIKCDQMYYGKFLVFWAKKIDSSNLHRHCLCWNKVQSWFPQSGTDSDAWKLEFSGSVDSILIGSMYIYPHLP